jgi:hypothetical protein
LNARLPTILAVRFIPSPIRQFTVNVNHYGESNSGYCRRVAIKGKKLLKKPIRKQPRAKRKFAIKTDKLNEEKTRRGNWKKRNREASEKLKKKKRYEREITFLDNHHSVCREIRRRNPILG